VALYHQTTSRDYIEFLRDENTTNGAGLVAYNQWVTHGKSAPVLKANTTVLIASDTCLPPIAYGTGNTLPNGDVPSLGWSGTPSLSINNFKLELENCLPRRMGYVCSSPVSASTPFGGGTLLLGGSPVVTKRFMFDIYGEASIPVPVTLGMVGTAMNYQVFFRGIGQVLAQVVGPDPGPGTQYGITNAVHVDFCP
jgi:hypothetical protein